MVANTSKPSAKRKRLHILYLLNDLLHHHHHGKNVTSSLQTHLLQLCAVAASFKDCPKHQRKIGILLDIWEEKEYLDKIFIAELREAIERAESARPTAIEAHVSTADSRENRLPRKGEAGTDAPYIMPAAHGDSSTPYYDLPAANMMPHIIPNSSHPINPQLMKPLQFVPGPPESSLVTAVKDFLKDVDRIFDAGKADEENNLVDIDELGQPMLKDGTSRESGGGESYYGWSKAFCEKMKDARRRRGQADGKRQGRSDSRGQDARARKRRRYSYSDSDSRSRDWSPSYSPSRSRSRRDDGYSNRRHRSYSRSISRSRRSSRSDDMLRGRRNGTFSPRSRSRSYSPKESTTVAPALPQQSNATSIHHPPNFPPLSNPPPAYGIPNPALLAQFITQNSHILRGGMPMPPHPPPPPLPFMSTGQWGSLPPQAVPFPMPAMPMNPQLSAQAVQYPIHGGMPIPPPPPPPPPPPAPPRDPR